MGEVMKVVTLPLFAENATIVSDRDAFVTIWVTAGTVVGDSTR